MTADAGIGGPCTPSVIDAVHVLFAGGGTLGHVTPALAVAESLRAAAPHARLTLAGPGAPREQRLAQKHGLDYVCIPAVRWPRHRRRAWRFVAGNAYGLVRAVRMLRRERPQVVVGLGGFASAPVGRAAALLGIPLVLLEQNASLGAANRWLLARAATLCAALPLDSVPNSARCPQPLIQGAPVPSQFHPATPARSQPPLLLVLGGSQGAPSLNAAAPLAIARNSLALRDWRIMHQTGEADRVATHSVYRRLGLAAEVVPFIDRLHEVLPLAELVVSRAGGSTLAELAATRTPAILVPWSRAAHGHQRQNARCFAAAGAALEVDESGDSAAFVDRLAAGLAELVRKPARRDAMRSAVSRFAAPDAACRIAAEILRLAVGRRPARAA